MNVSKNNILTIPKGLSFRIASIDLEDALTERLFAMGVRIDSMVRVIIKYRKKILVQISEELKIVLDDRIASRIFIENVS